MRSPKIPKNSSIFFLLLQIPKWDTADISHYSFPPLIRASTTSGIVIPKSRHSFRFTLPFLSSRSRGVIQSNYSSHHFNHLFSLCVHFIFHKGKTRVYLYLLHVTFCRKQTETQTRLHNSHNTLFYYCQKASILFAVFTQTNKPCADRR